MTDAEKLALLREFLAGSANCPCCDTDDVCNPGCTFSEDAPNDCEEMEQVREILRATA